MSTTMNEPILLELGPEQWDAFIDQTAAWLRNVHLAQSAFRQLAEDTAAKMQDPRVQDMLLRIVGSARRHEAQVDELYRLIGREPGRTTELLGEVTAKGRQALGGLLGLAGGAPGPWHDLRQLLLANLNAIGAFGAVEQLGLTLGLSDLAQTAFAIVRDKSTDQLVMEEFMLELAPQFILYDGASPSIAGTARGHHRSCQEPYPPPEPSGTQPYLPAPGRPENTIVGNQMGGNREEAADK